MHMRHFLERMPFGREVKLMQLRESPDVELCFTDGRVVGLEVTELVVPAQAKGAAVARRLCGDLTEALRAQGAKVGVHVFVPASCVGLSALTRTQYAHQLATLRNLVLARLPKDEEFFKYEHEALVAAGADAIDAIHVFPRDEAAAGHATHGPGTGGGFVQLGIDAKNSLAGDYRRNMPGAEQWLLLVVGFRSASGIWSAVIENRSYTSAFNRTFCLDYYDNKAFELSGPHGDWVPGRRS